MSKINPKHAYASEIFDGFGGIGSERLLGTKAMRSIRNFRILSDGSLKKRCGWHAPMIFDAPLRGYWYGALAGKSLCLAVAGSYLFRVVGNDETVGIGSLETQSGRVRFFAYGESLYLLDGNHLLRYDHESDTLVSASGYVPLYGRNWHPTELGEVNEPLNLLNNRIRLHYFNTAAATSFSLPFFVTSIDEVRLDGKKSTAYTLNATMDGFTVGSAAASVEVCCTIALESETRAQLISSPCALSDRVGSREHLMIYGSRAANRFFCAAEVTNNMYLASKVAYPDSDRLYFKQSGILLLGDGSHPITSVCRHEDRYLAFHKDGAYSVCFSEDSDAVSAYSLLYGMGCTATDAIRKLNGDPVIVNSAGIFLLHAPASERDAFTFTKLSDAISEHLSPQFAAKAITVEDRVHGELWFCDPTASGAPIYVLQTATRQWYIFDGVEPTFFFEHGERIGFGRELYLCLFDEANTADSNGPIVASFQTGYLPFSHPEALKRALRVSLCADAKSRATLRVESAHRAKSFSVSTDREQLLPAVFDHRIAIGRFALLSVTLTDTYGVGSRYYRLALFANL